MRCPHPKEPTSPVLHFEVNPIGILLANRTTWDRGHEDVRSLAKRYQPRDEHARWHAADHPGEGRKGCSGGKEDRRTGDGDRGHDDGRCLDGSSGHHGKVPTSRKTILAPGSSVGLAGCFRAERRTIALSPPGASCRTVFPRASSSLFRRLSRSIPYGKSRGNLSAGRTNSTSSSHGPSKRGSPLVWSTTVVVQTFGALSRPLVLLRAYGIPRTKTVISGGRGTVTDRGSGEQEHQSMLPWGGCIRTAASRPGGNSRR